MGDSDSLGNTKDQGRRKEYRLTNRERNCILTGETGTDRASRLKSNIRTKRNRLPDRFRELFLDVEDLELGGFFEPHEWEREWKMLMGISRSEHIDREFVSFGRRLGAMTRRLTLYPENSSETDVWADFIFGFIDGLCFHDWERHPRLRSEFLQDLLSKVEDRSELIFDEHASEEEAWFDRWSDRRLVEEESIQKIVDILDSEGIEQPRSIALRVYEILSQGANELGPEEITYEEVKDIVEMNELVLRRELRTKITCDIEELESRQWGELSALDLLEHTPDTIEPATSREIADEIGPQQNYLSNVVKLGLYFVKEEQIDGEVWDGIPVIESVGSNDTYGSREWQLTDYGKALRAIYLDRLHTFRSLKGKEFTREHFDHALMDPDVRERLG